jgi:hypothetical protein
MEMVKFFAMVAAIVATLAVTNLAEARGRHGCASCAMAGGGCPGGVCAMPVASPGKMAYAPVAAAPVVATPATAQPAPAVVATPAAPTYYANYSASRRGVFGWRR